jgi:hypothetical protein
MRPARSRYLVVAALLVSAACRAPAFTPTKSPAAPTPVPVTPTSAADEAAGIRALLAGMQQAVVAGDREAYLAHVDLSDPVFALEHTRWADEWSRAPLVGEYELTVKELIVSGDSATGELTVRWRTLGADSREARFAARFTRGLDGGWRYAGEQWLDQETDRLRVRAAPGLEAAADAVRAALPAVYAHGVLSLDYKPTGQLEVKLYASQEALVANTLLSLPLIHGWNEPGEALKLYAGSDAHPEGALAHEFTHFLEFDQAGTARSRMPWWLSEGLAVYIADDYAPSLRQRAQLSVVADWAASGELAPWETISVFEETPQQKWRYVYSQGYAFVTFVTEVYGAGPRNAWMKAMATEMDLAEATSTVFGKSFDALDAEFRAWLADQR